MLSFSLLHFVAGQGDRQQGGPVASGQTAERALPAPGPHHAGPRRKGAAARLRPPPGALRRAQGGRGRVKDGPDLGGR